jgi:hypothetical protein
MEFEFAIEDESTQPCFPMARWQHALTNNRWFTQKFAQVDGFDARTTQGSPSFPGACAGSGARGAGLGSESGTASQVRSIRAPGGHSSLINFLLATGLEPLFNFVNTYDWVHPDIPLLNPFINVS